MRPRMTAANEWRRLGQELPLAEDMIDESADPAGSRQMSIRRSFPFRDHTNHRPPDPSEFNHPAVHGLGAIPRDRYPRHLDWESN
jgi:hypothetical protein